MGAGGGGSVEKEKEKKKKKEMSYLKACIDRSIQSPELEQVIICFTLDEDRDTGLKNTWVYAEFQKFPSSFSTASLLGGVG